MLLGNEEGLIKLDEGGVMCITCGKVCKEVWIGKRHVREIHRPIQQAQCRICNKFYKNERLRDHHYKSVHGVPARQMKNLIVVPDTIPRSNYVEDSIKSEHFE